MINVHRRGEVVLQGTPICPGVGIGRVHVVDPALSRHSHRFHGSQQVRAEKTATPSAVRRDQAPGLREHVATVHGNSTPETKAILDVHEAVLTDESFHDQVRKRIATERKGAEWSLWQEADALDFTIQSRCGIPISRLAAKMSAIWRIIS